MIGHEKAEIDLIRLRSHWLLKLLRLSGEMPEVFIIHLQ